MTLFVIVCHAFETVCKFVTFPIVLNNFSISRNHNTVLIIV